MAKRTAKSNLKSKAASLKGKRVIHILSGSVAAYKAGDLIRDMREEGANLSCVLTEAAKKFVSPLVVRALSGSRVYSDFFAEDTPYDVLHTSLAEEADVVLIAPASADFIARLAAGFCDDLASCIVLATKRPVLIAPAMNDNMYHHPITQQNIKKLEAIGYQFIEPVEGSLVCGRDAMGHISDNELILKKLHAALKKK